MVKSNNQEGKRRTYRLSFHPQHQRDVIDILDSCSRPLRNEIVADAIRRLSANVKNQGVIASSAAEEMDRNSVKTKQTISDIFNKNQ